MRWENQKFQRREWKKITRARVGKMTRVELTVDYLLLKSCCWSEKDELRERTEAEKKNDFCFWRVFFSRMSILTEQSFFF
jgi:hypothetical protein